MPNPGVRLFNPDTIHPPAGYTHVAEVSGGKMVFIAGQVAIDKAGNIVGEGDMRTQAKQVFENLKAALESAGGGFDSLVKVTVFVVDMSQLATVREVRNEYLGTTTPPASTAVGVTALARPEFLIEIEAIAAV